MQDGNRIGLVVVGGAEAPGPCGIDHCLLRRIALSGGVLLDRSMSLLDRIVIYRRAPEQQQRMVYDFIIEPLRSEYESSDLSQVGPFEEAFPEPPGMAEYRAVLGAKAGNAGQPEENAAEAEIK